jgi:hypothetical protein
MAVELGILEAPMAELPQDRQATQEEVLRHIVHRRIEKNNPSMKIADMTCRMTRNGNVWTSGCDVNNECAIQPLAISH